MFGKAKRRKAIHERLRKIPNCLPAGGSQQMSNAQSCVKISDDRDRSEGLTVNSDTLLVLSDLFLVK